MTVGGGGWARCAWVRRDLMLLVTSVATLLSRSPLRRRSLSFTRCTATTAWGSSPSPRSRPPGTGIAIGKRAGLLDEKGWLPRMKTFLFIEALGAAAGGMASASSNTTYIESSAGVEDGGRTGITSVVTGTLFLLCLLIVSLQAAKPCECGVLRSRVTGRPCSGA